VIKGYFTYACLRIVGPGQERNLSRKSRREAAIWQRRFWEHTISDEVDLEKHLDYIHYNPIKHGYVTRTADWPWSSFHRFVKEGVYDPDWIGGDEGRLNMLDWDRFTFGD
jgi:putative transposase